MEIGNFGFGDSGGGGGGGTIGGGGTLNYIAKFTPNGTTINNSLLFDNGTSVGLGTITPDASAILELSSTTQGFATPRMTTLQRDAIVAPVVSLLIFNTSSGFFNYWDGVAWIQIDTSTGGDVSGIGTTNYAVKWTDGANSVIGDGTWAFSGNDYYPVTTGSNIGDATHRIGTIFMASVFDYANNLTFFNGASTTMTLTTSGQLGIGTTPNAMLDVLASGSGTVGLNLNTSSTQDAKLYFRTNNAANARSQIYLADATQTLNVYTVNNDTIFWNGNGLAQTKTLTLFTDTTAKFENNIGIAVSPNSTTRVIISGIDNTSAHYGLKIQDLVGNPLLYVRNDGYVTINGLNVGKSVNQIFSNTAFGVDALSVATGIENTAIGYQALQNNTTGSTNTAVGNNALLLNTIGIQNTAIGYNSNRSSIIGNNNTSIGFYTLFNNTGDNNTAIGDRASYSNTSGSQNVSIGRFSLYTNLIGQHNVSIGHNTLNLNTSSGSVAIGSGASAQSVGGNLVSVGRDSLAELTTGIQNTVLGWNSGRGIVTGSYNTILGSNIIGLNSALNNSILIGNSNGLVSFYTNSFGNTMIGNGVVDATARLQVKGIDSTLGNYAFKADDSLSNPLLYVRNDAKVSIGKVTTLTTLDILGDTTNTLFKLNNANFAFADKLRIDNNGSFYSGSINAFGGFGTGTYTIDHLNYTFNTSFSTYLAFTNAGGAGNKTSYGIIGAAIGSADSDYRLVILNSDTSTISGSGLKVLSTGGSVANDGFDYYNYGVNINSSGVFTNSGSGTSYKIGLNVNVSNGEVNYAALFNGGSVGIGTTTPATSALLDLTSTTGALLVPRMTTIEKNALTAVNGMIIYDTTLNKFQGYEASAWVNLV
jgi:hypothetical protein